VLWLAVSESLPVLCSVYHMPRSLSEVSKRRRVQELDEVNRDAHKIQSASSI